MFDKKKENNENGRAVEVTEKDKERADDYDDFFELDVIECPDYKIIVYRKENRGKSSTLIRLDKFVGMVPDMENDIGLVHGRGTYIVHGGKPGDKASKKTRVVNYDDPIWDKRKEENDRKMAGVEVKETGGLPPGFEMAVSMMERMYKMIDAKNTPFDKTLAPHIEKLTGIHMTLVEKSIRERNQLWDEFKKKADEPPIVSDTVEVEGWEAFLEHPIVSGLTDLIGEHAEEWLNSKGLKRRKGTEAMKKDPNFIAGMQDPKKIYATYYKGCNDPKIGKEIMDQVFNELGIKVNPEG